MLQKVKASPAHSILFYESLNHSLQDEQLDFQIHFLVEINHPGSNTLFRFSLFQTTQCR